MENDRAIQGFRFCPKWIEREFADGGDAFETFARDRADGGEDRKRDGEIVMAAFLGQVGGGEIDGGAFRRKRQAEGGEGQPAAAPRLLRHGFEIVDKRSGKEVYLDGSWAEMFQQQIIAWQVKTPTQEEVEETLESYSGLAQHPVLVH